MISMDNSFLRGSFPPLVTPFSAGKVDYKKDSDEAKQYKVTTAPTLILLDPTKEPAALLKTITGGTPKTLLKDLQDAKEKLGK